MDEPAGQQARAEPQQASVDPDRAAHERAPVVERGRHGWCEARRCRGEPHEPATSPLEVLVELVIRSGRVGVGRGELQDVGLERPGDEHGHPDPERGDLERQRLGPTFERGLGRGVGADGGHAPERTHARDHDDAASAGGAHVGQQGPGEPNGSEEVRREDLVPHVGRQLFEAADAGHARVVHDPVGCADGVADLGCGLSDRCRVVEVEPDRDEPGIIGARAGGRAQVLEPDGRGAHRGYDGPALGVEVGGRGHAEPPRCAGHDRRFGRHPPSTPQRPPSAGASTCGRPDCAARPGDPDAREVRPGLAGLLVEAVGVVHLRLGERATGRPPTVAAFVPLDEREADAVAEVGDVQDREHHEEGPQRRPSTEEADPLGQLLGLGLPVSSR